MAGWLGATQRVRDCRGASVTANGSAAQARFHRDDVSFAARYANQIARQCGHVCDLLCAVVGEAEPRTRLRPMMLGQIDGDEVTDYPPSWFLRDWARGHYRGCLNAICRGQNPSTRRVSVRVGRGRSTDRLPQKLAAPRKLARNANAAE
jgi:hypothetical protein